MNIYQKYFKRIFDMILSTILLLFMLIPIAIISIINLLWAGKPILFRQDRVGRYGKLFRVYKFRTMINRTTDDSSVTVRGDRRVTPLGGFMRKWKLDELPQLWNVFKGDMSFVGPRPDVAGYMDDLKGEERRLLELMPGVTGPATLKYRNEEELLAAQADPVRFNDEVIFPEKIRINLEYLRRSSLWLDLKIILITAGILKNDANNFWMGKNGK